MQTCLATHSGDSRFLDADGCHAAANCPATKKAVLAKHKNLCRVLQRAAKKAGMKVRLEPDSYSLLLERIPQSQCRRIFPLRADAAYAQKFQDVIDALDFVASPECEMDEPAKVRHVQSRVDVLPRVDKSDRTGLRVDVEIENEVTGETRWVDVTAIHTGSASYARAELKAVSARQFAAQVACMVDVLDPNKLDPSPALVKRETAKFNKYSRLLHVAKRQTLEGRRRKEPVFAAFAVTDYGEVGLILETYLNGSCINSRSNARMRVDVAMGAVLQAWCETFAMNSTRTFRWQ